MANLFAETFGIAIVLASVAGTTASLYGRARRGSGRVAVALVWIGTGVVGLTAIGFGFAPKLSALVVLGGIVAASLLMCATVLGVLRVRDVADARRRDSELGYPPVPRTQSPASVIFGAGLVALITSAIVIAPWLLLAAAAAQIPPERIVVGLIADTAIATPLVWIALASIAIAHGRRVAADAELLSRGVESRVADADEAAFHAGFAAGQEGGRRNTAFETSWE